MTHGWICINRELREHSMWCSSEPFDSRSAWIDILLRAIPDGRIYTTISALSAAWGWSRSRVNRFLAKKAHEQALKVAADTSRTQSEHKPDTKRTLIEVCNFEEFRRFIDLREVAADTKRTLNGHKSDTKRTVTPSARARIYNNININTSNTNTNTNTNTNSEEAAPSAATRAKARVRARRVPDLFLGRFGHFAVTESERADLVNRYGPSTFESYVTKIDRWVENGGRDYKNYYLAFESWVERDAAKAAGQVRIPTTRAERSTAVLEAAMAEALELETQVALLEGGDL